MLEVEPTGECGRTATGSGRNGNEAVAGAASEAFPRWLHCRYAHVELYWQRHTVSLHDIMCTAFTYRPTINAL